VTKKLRAAALAVAALLAALTVATVQGVVVSDPTVTGTVTSVDSNDSYTLYLDGGSTPYVLGTTTVVDQALLVDTYPQNLVGKRVLITYHACEGQNYVLSLQVLPDQAPSSDGGRTR
jgi:hypothetical protein